LSAPWDKNTVNTVIDDMGLDYVFASYLSILDVSALIKKLDLVITPDTSMVHIASAFNTSTVSIYPNNRDNHRLWSPRSTLSSSVFSNDTESIQGFDLQEVVNKSIGLINRKEV